MVASFGNWMTTKAAIVRAAVGLVWLVAATAVCAQPVSTARLVQPSNLFQVSSSPSGTRVAGLVSVTGVFGDPRVQLVVSQWQGDQLRPVVTHWAGRYQSAYQSVQSYRWFDDDYLMLQVEGLNAGWIIPVVAGVQDNTWRRFPPFTKVIQYPWGDKDHALLQESSRLCRSPDMSFCLFSLNVNHWGGQLLSEPLRLLPVRFLAVSPGEIYASGRQMIGQNALGPPAEYHLGNYGRWYSVPDGTVAKRRAALHEAEAPTASLMAAAQRAGIQHPTFVSTAHTDRVVGIIGHAPEPAFVALAPRLQVVQTWLATHYPTARVSIGGLNDALTSGLVTVWDTDLPPTPFFLRPNGKLVRYQAGSPAIRADQLGQTHMEPQWAPGEGVAVTLPPAGTALRGAVVIPVVASPTELQDPLHVYRPEVQAFALQGIAVVQLLAPISDAFATDAEGAIWRAGLDAHLKQVVDHASSDLSRGKPICLYGQGLAGDLALAAGGLPHVGCVVAANAILNASQLSRVLLTGLPVNVGAAIRLIGPTTQMLNRDFPAAFGNQRDQLNESVSWVPGLPSNVMLVYDAVRYADATRGYTVGNFADGSTAFRAAARKAG
ncbi:MAG: hypothetical protein ACREU2_15405, partial [Steroidobacteraceae bacterium]